MPSRFEFAGAKQLLRLLDAVMAIGSEQTLADSLKRITETPPRRPRAPSSSSLNLAKPFDQNPMAPSSGVTEDSGALYVQRT